MQRIKGKITFANVVASLALFVALGGGAYAATQLPKNSVGTKQLQKLAVTPAKLSAASKSALTGAEGPHGPVGARGPMGLKGDRGETGPAGNLNTELRRDVTLRGRFHVDAVAGKALDEHFDSISFGFQLAASPQLQVIQKGSGGSPECPGSVAEPRAGPGYLCLYADEEKNLELEGASPFAFGADVVAVAKKAGLYVFSGSWAVTGS